MPDVALSPVPKNRLTFVDVAKGIGILCVVALHSSNRSSRAFSTHGDAEWWTLFVINRLMAFAVPMFLSISAFLWARSQARKATDSEGTWKRFVAILHPYLVWSLIFLILRVTLERTPGEDLSKVLGPADLAISLVWGKAAFHLYFMSVLLQAALVFPLMMWPARRVSFTSICLIGFLIQALVFFVNSKVQYRHVEFAGMLPFPGSSVLWYLSSLLPATWLGLRWPVSRPRLKQLLGASSLIAFLGGAPFLWLQVQDAKLIPTSGTLENWSQQVFVFGAGLAVISLLAIGAENGERWLAWLGAASLQFYLLHPIVMRLTGGPRVVGVLSKLPAAPLFSYLVTLIGTLVIVLILNRLGVEKWLFGRASPPFPARKSGQEA